MRFRSGLIASVLILLLAALSVGGATYSWFTAESALIENVFIVNIPQPQLTFNDEQVAIGAYVYIKNNEDNPVLFQKIGDNWALLREITEMSSRHMNNDKGKWDNYYTNFSFNQGSLLLSKTEAEKLDKDEIRTIGTEWWLRTGQGGNADCISAEGELDTMHQTNDQAGIRPLLIIDGSLPVTGGDGTAGSPYTLVVGP